MKSPYSSLGWNIQCVFSALGRSKSKIIPAFPLTKIYLIIVIEKAVALERGFKRDCNWRRKRDLNPRDRFQPYSLSRGAPSPLGYFSKKVNIKKIGGEGGIRTHVPVKANGFQDRLVMTTSIPLHNY